MPDGEIKRIFEYLVELVDGECVLEQRNELVSRLLVVGCGWCQGADIFGFKQDA